MAEILFTIPGIIQGRLIGFLMDIAMAILVIYYIRSRKKIYIRRVPGLDAIEEAVGRCAEMGKPVMASFGIGGFTYWTLAGLAILSHVARLAARTGTRIIVPTGGGDQSLIVRPGAVIMTGSHASEAMNIAETSNAVGAITITSGSYIANVAVLACASDYILIGEEAPAAGAYLSEDPSQRASIRVQDIFKWIGLAIIIIGLLALSFGNTWIVNILST